MPSIRKTLVRVALPCSVSGGVFLQFRKRSARYKNARLALTLGLLLVATTAWGQVQPWRGSADSSGPTAQPPSAQAAPGYAGPNGPNAPAPQQPQQPPPPPFQLTPQEQAQVDAALLAWERESAKVKTFECGFMRWEYDPVFGASDVPSHVDEGLIKYAAPDKGLFEVTGEVVNNQVVKGQRAEKWMTDGRSIFAYNYPQKRLEEHKLPPEMQGANIANGPVPFLFGAKANDLSHRYWIRIITPQNVQGQIWLEVHPRFQQDAANYRQVDVILQTNSMLPTALQIHATNDKQRVVYNFGEPLINDPLRIIKSDPFRASLPLGWQKVVEEPHASQVGQQPLSDRR